MRILVANIIDSEVAAFHEDGLKVYDAIRKAVDEGQHVELSFEGIDQCATQFLNAAIGKLYMEIGEPKVDSSVSFIHGSLRRLPSKLEDVKWCALHVDRYNDIVNNAVAH